MVDRFDDEILIAATVPRQRDPVCAGFARFVAVDAQFTFKDAAMSRSTLLLPLFARGFLRALFLILLGGSTFAASFSHAAIPATERAVLIALYNSTNGAGWSNRTHWRNAADTDFNAAGTECTWFGVSCSTGDANVVQIALLNNNLTGTLPDLDDLTKVRYFDVFENNLTGAVPGLTRLTTLELFSVRNNKFSGSIPSLSGLVALRDFDVSGNELSGSIPALAGLTSLSTFYAFNNRLTGSIPELVGLVALRNLSVSNNQLTGSIPLIAGLVALVQFDAKNNQLTGAIPVLVGSPTLRVFDVYNNRLSGLVPQLAGLTKLERFDVSVNRLTGVIPPLTGLAALREFYLGNNQLTGPIPSLVGLTTLQIIKVDGNQLTGAIPAVPAPTSSLIATRSQLCPNQLTVSVDPAWDLATFETLWSEGCTAALPGQTLSFGAPPTLKVGGAGLVSVTASPTPNSSAPIVFASQTPLVCSVDSASGQVSVAAAAIAGNLCVITADKANDAAFNAAPQVQQSITIEALAATFNVTPSASANGAISPSTVQAIASGATTAFTITPNAGYRIDTVTGCGGALSGNTYTTAAITADCGVLATFALLTASESVAVPTLGQWALLLLALLIVAAAAIMNRARQPAGNRFARAPINPLEN
jgi:IPTL-CTERM motif